MPPPVGAHAVGADALGTAPGGPYDHHGDHHGEQDGPGMLKEVRQAAVTVVAVAVFGALLGVLWWKLAPSVPLVGDVADGGWVVYLKDSEGEQAIGVDGTFTLLALAFGALSAVVVFLLRRRGVCRWWWPSVSAGCSGRCWRGGSGCSSGPRRTSSRTPRRWARG